MEQEDKENWLPAVHVLTDGIETPKDGKGRRRSTGIMKGADGSMAALLSPKPTRKKRRKSLANKRVSFGGAEVRLYQKDVDWTSPKNKGIKHRSVDVGAVPFNDVTSPKPLKAQAQVLVDLPSSPTQPISQHEASEKEEQSLEQLLPEPEMQNLMDLVDQDEEEEDDDNEDQGNMTMEMTTNHGQILSAKSMRDLVEKPVALTQQTNLLSLVDEDEEEEQQQEQLQQAFPSDDETMEMTENISKIHGAADVNGECTMEMTENISKIHGAADVKGECTMEMTENISKLHGAADVNGECTMEMTENISKIHGTADANGECTMEMTVNYSTIAVTKPTQQDTEEIGDCTMEFTTNHSKLISTQSRENDEQANDISLNRSLVISSTSCDAPASVPMSDAEVLPDDAEEELHLPTEPIVVEDAPSQQDGEFTIDLTGCHELQLKRIFEGDAYDRTIDLPKIDELNTPEQRIHKNFQDICDGAFDLTSDISQWSRVKTMIATPEKAMPDSENSAAMEPEALMSFVQQGVDADAADGENRLELDNVDDFLRDMSSNDKASQQAEFAPRTFEEFTAALGIRFLNDVSRKTASFGLSAVSDATITDKERLVMAYVTEPELSHYEDSVKKLQVHIEGIKGITTGMEQWIDSQSPPVFAALQKTLEQAHNDGGSDVLKTTMKRLKHLRKVSARNKWQKWRSGLSYQLFLQLEKSALRLRADATVLKEFDASLDAVLDACDSYNAPSLVSLRDAVDEQHDAVIAFRTQKDELAGDLRRAEMRLDELQSEQRMYDERIHAQHEFSSDAAELDAARQNAELRAALLDACVDWHIVENASDANQLRLRFGTRYEIDVRLSGPMRLRVLDATNDAGEAKDKQEGQEDEWRRAAVRVAGLHDLLDRNDAGVITEAAHRLGRIQGLENELQRLQRTVFAELLLSTEGRPLVCVHASSISSRQMIEVTADIGASYPFSTRIRNVQVRCGNISLDAIHSAVQQCSGFGFVSQLATQLQKLVA